MRLSGSAPHVAWLVYAPVEAGPDGVSTSAMASVRYRCLSPVRELSGRGMRHSILHNLHNADPAAIASDLQQRQVDVVVVGKPSEAMVELSRLIRGQGACLVADFCDDAFDDPHFGPPSRALAALADQLIASTPSLAQALERRLGRAAKVISDPYEGPRGVPRFAPGGDRLELLWFGNGINYATLESVLPQLLALSDRRPLRLTVVTSIEQIAPPPPASPSFCVEYTPWTADGVWRRLAACHLVVIPTLGTAQYHVKSPNRLVEAIWAGRAAAAHFIPSYGDFGEFCWLGGDITSAIAAMIADPGAVERRIAAGQAFIARRHAPAVIADQWLEILLEATTNLGRAPTAGSRR